MSANQELKITKVEHVADLYEVSADGLLIGYLTRLGKTSKWAFKPSATIPLHQETVGYIAVCLKERNEQ